jgi:serine protease Do
MFGLAQGSRTTMLKRKEFILGAAAGLIVAAGATAGGVINWPGAHAEARPGQLVPSAGAAGLAFAPPQGAPLSFADIVQQVAPAVVQIEVETRVERPTGGIQIPGLPGFVIPGPQGGQDEDAEPQTAQGAGSGFFISKDGFIVTNNHVVADAVSIKVVLNDGRKLDATVVGRDENTDLAVVKVEGNDFNFVTFEETAAPRVGDWVVAVGNPFGLGGTATAGIVSAISRADPSGQSRGFVDFLQIDAAINRGNSGGPTFDIYGRVIGVNSAIISPTGGSVGIGFAIPASTAKPIVDKLMRGEAIERGYLGVSMRTMTDDERSALGLPDNVKGALINDVTPGGPAERGGLRSEDVVVSVNGRATETGDALTRAVAAAAVGDELRVELFREGRRQTVTVRAGRRPPESELNALRDGTQGGASPSAPQPGGEAIEGLTVQSLSPALRQRYRLDAGASGVVVTAVAPRSKAGQLRMPEGTVISRAFSRPVNSPADLKAAVDAARAAGRPSVLLQITTPGSGGPALFALELAKGD